jgi:hypothetical protein
MRSFQVSDALRGLARNGGCRKPPPSRTLDVVLHHEEVFMGNDKDSKLRGPNVRGADQVDAVDHVEYAEKRNPDTEVHLDAEKDSLYADGLDVEDESLTLADTKGMSNRG